MVTPFTSLYLTTFVLAAFIAYAGVENVSNLVKFIEAKIKYQWILLRLYQMHRNLAKSLNIPLQSYSEFVKKYEENHNG